MRLMNNWNSKKLAFPFWKPRLIFNQTLIVQLPSAFPNLAFYRGLRIFLRKNAKFSFLRSLIWMCVATHSSPFFRDWIWRAMEKYLWILYCEMELIMIHFIDKIGVQWAESQTTRVLRSFSTFPQATKLDLPYPSPLVSSSQTSPQEQLLKYSMSPSTPLLLLLHLLLKLLGNIFSFVAKSCGEETVAYPVLV